MEVGERTQKQNVILIISQMNKRDIFVPREQSSKLKQLGFNEMVIAKYQKLSEGANYQLQLLGKERNCNVLDTAISAPTWDQIFEWFRNEHKLHSVFNIYNDFTFDYGVCNLEGLYSTKIASQTNFKTYEEARLKCLEKLIELCAKQ